MSKLEDINDISVGFIFLTVVKGVKNGIMLASRHEQAVISDKLVLSANSRWLTVSNLISFWGLNFLTVFDRHVKVCTLVVPYF